MNVLRSAKELLNIGVGVFCRRMAVATGKARLYAVRLRVLVAKMTNLLAAEGGKALSLSS